VDAEHVDDPVTFLFGPIQVHRLRVTFLPDSGRRSESHVHRDSCQECVLVEDIEVVEAGV
jgi:hypothetical protein